jgi:hypothetical protein
MKKLFLVVGPESSGTRLTTRILCESGCFGDFEHYQRLDEFVTDHNEDLYSIIGESKLVVFRRSIPHGGEFPFIPDMELMFSFYNFDPYIIVPVRNLYELCKSKIKNNEKTSMEDAYDSFQKEMSFIVNTIKEYKKILFFDTSFLFKFPELSLRSLKLWTELDIPVEKVKEFLYDADANYLEE